MEPHCTHLYWYASCSSQVYRGYLMFPQLHVLVSPSPMESWPTPLLLTLHQLEQWPFTLVTLAMNWVVLVRGIVWMEVDGVHLYPFAIVSWTNTCFNLVHEILIQLLTVAPSPPPPMEQWTHPLEPPSWWLLPTPVTLDTLWLELWPGLVRLIQYGASLHPPVLVCLV